MLTKSMLRMLLLGLAVAVPRGTYADDKPTDNPPPPKEAGRDEPGPEGKGPAELFRELDANKDGKLTADEIVPEHRRHYEHLLRAAGKKEGESLSHEEFLKALQPDQRKFDGVPDMGGRRERRGEFDPGQMFDRWDKNKDGKLTKDELPEQARERLQPIFERLKKDSLTREEFVKSRDRIGGGGGGGGFNPGQFFKQLDRNSDGKLTRDEVPDRMRERFDQMLKSAGKQEGESLSSEEFQKQMGRGPRDGGRPGMGGRRFAIGEPAEFLKKFDKNGDGKVTLEEVDPEQRRGFESTLDRLKKDPDAGLTLDDLRKLREQEVAQAPEKRSGTGDEADNRRPQRGEGGERRNMDGEEGGRRDGDRPGRPLHFPPQSPLLKLLDANHDGKITKDEISRIGEVFEKLDVNHDGQLDPSELMGPPPERRMGDRGPGDREERGRPEMNEEGMKGEEGNKSRDDRGRPGKVGGGGRLNGRRIFERQDTDKDGKISKEEAEGPLKRNFEKFDSNHDGFLDQEEVRKGMQELFGSGGGERRPGRNRPSDADGKKGGPEKEGDKKSED